MSDGQTKSRKVVISCYISSFAICKFSCNWLLLLFDQPQRVTKKQLLAVNVLEISCTICWFDKERREYTAEHGNVVKGNQISHFIGITLFYFNMRSIKCHCQRISTKDHQTNWAKLRKSLPTSAAFSSTWDFDIVLFRWEFGNRERDASFSPKPTRDLRSHLKARHTVSRCFKSH